MENLEKTNSKKDSKYKKLIIATCITLLVSLWTLDAKSETNNPQLDNSKGWVETIKNNLQWQNIEKVYRADDWEAKFERSKKYTPEKELEYFLNFFGIKKEMFSAKVREIQEKNNLKSDGILGRNTSKTLFLKYYFPELENIGYKWISDKMREIHENTPDWKNIDETTICKEEDDLEILLSTGTNEINRTKVSEEDIMKLRYIIYQEMHKKHHEVNLFDKRVLWGYGNINYDAPVYPFINPKIKWVPDSLEDAKYLYGDLVKRISWNNGIIVGKDSSWKYVLVFYKGGKRFLTTYVSPGKKGHRTAISNLHEIRRHDKYHRSRKYENVPMSYAVWLSGGFFFHNGVTTGYGRSHGCIRMPMMYAKILYEETKDLKHMPFVFQPKVKFEEIEREEESNSLVINDK